MKIEKYNFKDFKLEVDDHELLLTHPACEFVSSFNPKFPPYHYIIELQNRDEELKEELEITNTSYKFVHKNLVDTREEVTQLKTKLGALEEFIDELINHSYMYGSDYYNRGKELLKK